MYGVSNYNPLLCWLTPVLYVNGGARPARYSRGTGGWREELRRGVGGGGGGARGVSSSLSHYGLPPPPSLFKRLVVSRAAANGASFHRAATLPITFRCMNDKCGVDPRISRFVLPIGATVNMDGTALFVSVGTIFIAQMNELPLGIGEYATIIVTATAASVASASVPSAALVLILIVLTSVNLPAEDVSLLFAIDWLVDRFRTTNNMLGDCYTAAIVEHWSQSELKAMDAEASAEAHYADAEKAADLAPLDTSMNGGKAIGGPEEVLHVEVEMPPKENNTTTKI